MPPKLRDKEKGKIGESSKTQISSKPIKSWYEICHEEENEKSSPSSKSSKNTIIQDAQDPNEIGSQIKKWIESLSQSPEVVLAFSQMKEETPLKQIAAEATKISKNKEIVLHKPKSLKNFLKEASLQDVFLKEIAVSSQTATQKSSQYFPNKYFEKILVIEEEFSEKPPHILAKELFNGWHFKALDSQKLQRYYENILVQTRSSAAPDQTTAKFLQAKSTASAMLAQAKTKKEYKKLMAEMLSSLDFESEDEKSSASSIKTVDLADDTTSVTITRTKKK
ncbi:hypothetical protein Gotur_035762 [Gossypium turneri]